MAVWMQQSFSIYPFDPPGNVAGLRTEVRAFLKAHEAKLGVPNCWVVGDPEFSSALGAAGFLGMILPKAVGGHERHPLERYIVIEELLAAGAPVGAHWIADPGLRAAVLWEMAMLAPVMPREVEEWLGMAEDWDRPTRLRRMVRANEDWRSGRMFDIVARNERLRARAA